MPVIHRRHMKGHIHKLGMKFLRYALRHGSRDYLPRWARWLRKLDAQRDQCTSLFTRHDTFFSTAKAMQLSTYCPALQSSKLPFHLHVHMDTVRSLHVWCQSAAPTSLPPCKYSSKSASRGPRHVKNQFQVCISYSNSVPAGATDRF